MDFTKLKNVSDEGTWIDIETPDGEKTDVRVYILGSDSDTYRKLSREQNNKRFKKGKLDIDASEIENDAFNLTIACVLDWEGVEGMEFTKANARQLFTEHRWLRDQVEAAIHDRSNFISGFETD